jgi:hypothetical protein
VQSPCTTYNDTYEALRGNPAKGIEAMAYDLPGGHDPGDRDAAMALVRKPGIPLGVIYQDPNSTPMDQRLAEARDRLKVRTRSVDQLLTALEI